MHGDRQSMKSINQMTIIGIVIILGLLIAVGIVVMVTSSSRSSSSALRTGIIEQSKQYVEAWGSKPFETLTSEQKLLVLHAYANLGKYQEVIQRAEAMIDIFRQLAPERKQAFGEMVEQAYRQIGREQDAVAFRYHIGL
jgi:hypothetical protein